VAAKFKYFGTTVKIKVVFKKKLREDQITECLCGFETWSLALREGHTEAVSEQGAEENIWT
jgi:hypothetical protein